jgi:hypothetical protein
VQLLAGEERLGLDLDADLHRGAEDAVDGRSEHDQLSDADGMEEVQAVDSRSDAGASRVADGGHGGGKVDQVHDFAAENVAEHVRVIGQGDFRILGDGSANGFALHGRSVCVFTAAVRLGISLRLTLESFAGGTLGKRAGGGRVIEDAVGEVMVVALDDVGDADAALMLGKDGEADRVGSVADGKTGAFAAGVAEVAEGPDGGFVGGGGLTGGRAADACPRIAEGEHRVARRDGARARLQGVKIGAGHRSEV